MRENILVSTEGLKLNKDFEIVSLLIINEDFETKSFEEYFNEESRKYYDKYTDKSFASQLISEKNISFDEDGIAGISQTLMDVMPSHFLKINDINFDIAMMVGFGVVKMKSGEYKNEYLMYNIIDDVAIENVDDAVLWFEEMVKLSMYKMLTDEKSDNKKLEKLLNENPEFLMSLCQHNEEEVIERLSKQFSDKKGGKNVIPFKRGAVV